MPVPIPATVPVEPIVATPVVPLLQVPPPVALLRDDVAPVHTSSVPAIAAGVVLTVTVTTFEQPLANA